MSLHSFNHQWLYSPLLEPGCFFNFCGRGISPSQGLYLHTGQHKDNKCTQTYMTQERFEPATTAFERAKTTVHALHRTATMLGRGVR